MKFLFVIPCCLVLSTSVAFADGFYVLGQVTRSSNSLNNDYFNGELASGGATGLSSSDDGSGYQWRLQGG